ncbi:DUF5710 domain-containing protein [Streptomyces sp. NPDC057696]|uniref:DUF5710 domain-containing protein n=1 Tax=Streptomyces sp. NPDC057696 TaxID=3346218 RepID=UPI0036B4273F
MSERIWLNVPFPEKDQAKARGARWDAKERRWYAPQQGMASLHRWALPTDSTEDGASSEEALQRSRRETLRAASRIKSPRPQQHKKRPSVEVVGPEQVHALLDLTFHRESPDHPTLWTTVPPWHWRCHMCESNAHPPRAISTAKVQKGRWGRCEIAFEPHEFWHVVEQHGRPASHRTAVLALVLQALDPPHSIGAIEWGLPQPGRAATWDSARGCFEIVAGTQIDWRM